MLITDTILVWFHSQSGSVVNVTLAGGPTPALFPLSTEHIYDVLGKNPAISSVIGLASRKSAAVVRARD